MKPILEELNESMIFGPNGETTLTADRAVQLLIVHVNNLEMAMGQVFTILNQMGIVDGESGDSSEDV